MSVVVLSSHGRAEGVVENTGRGRCLFFEGELDGCTKSDKNAYVYTGATLFGCTCFSDEK